MTELNTTYAQNGIDRRMKQMRTYMPQISNYAMLKIALKGETAFTFRHWLLMQYLLANRLYIRTWIKIFDHGARRCGRDVNLRPHRTNLYNNR